MLNELPSIVAEYIRAVNAFDTDAILATFAEDALVNDNHREIVGTAALRRWLDKEIVGDRVTMQVRDVREHYGEIILNSLYDGDYDKTNLPKELILTNYFRVHDGKIVSLFYTHNKPSPF
jgi:RecJ-like exonuclease